MAYLDSDDIDIRFGYHPPRSRNRVASHELIRDRCKRLARQFTTDLPEGRERSLAITKIEEAMFWANAALARADDPDAEVSAEDAAAGP